MGNCTSKQDGEGPKSSRKTRVDQQPPSEAPPDYEAVHNFACSILKKWEKEGQKSKGFNYVIYLGPDELLNEEQRETRRWLMKVINELAKVHQLNVRVKCVGRLDNDDYGAHATEQKEFYKEMLELEHKSALVAKWKNRPASLQPSQSNSPNGYTWAARQSLKSNAQEIDDLISKIGMNNDLDDANVKRLIEPALVAALSQYHKGWKIADYLTDHPESSEDQDSIKAEGISKLQAQFLLQARAACTSLESSEGSIPTIAINFVPPVIPNAVYQNVKRYLQATQRSLKERAASQDPDERQDRQDLFAIQFVSLNINDNGNGRSQWQRLDDGETGAMDIIDHLALNIEKLRSNGISSFFPMKLMLGAVDHELDRRSPKKSPLYGNGHPGLPTYGEMQKCSCNTSKEMFL